MRASPAALAAIAACSYHSPSLATLDGETDTPIDGIVTGGPCDPLPAPAAATRVADVPTLRSAVATAQPGQTITLADGTYSLAGGALVISTPGVTLRSASGNARGVILDGGNALAAMVVIDASDVTLASMTLTGASNAAVYVTAAATADVTGVRLYDLTLVDNGAPAVQIEPFNNVVAGPFADNGSIACSRFAVTSADLCNGAPIGISGESVRGWVVRDNRFEHLACAASPRRTVEFRYGSRDIEIRANVFVGSAMNLMFGFDASIPPRIYVDAPPAGCAAQPQQWGGLICDNAIAGLDIPPITGNTDFEEGIALWTTCDTWVIHNTVVSPAAPETFHDIEYRFAGTQVHLVNNLVAQRPATRDGGQQDTAWANSNVMYGATTDFVNAFAGDLHPTANAIIAAGASIETLGRCGADADGKPRNLAAPTPGAYER